MVITFTPTTGSAVTLAGADSNQFDQPIGLTMEARDVTQVTTIVRGTKPDVQNRMNREYSVSFSTERQYSDWAAAVAACNTHLTKFDLLGTVTLVQGATTVTINNARVSARLMSITGAVTMWAYSITGTP